MTCCTLDSAGPSRVQWPEQVQDTWEKVSYVPTDVLPVHLQEGGHPLPTRTHAHSVGFPDGLLDGRHEVNGAFDGEVSAHDLQRNEKRERSHHCSAAALPNTKQS